MTPVVRAILIATVSVFFLQQTLPGFWPEQLVFAPATVLTHPWTLVTYMFLHQGFTHILFNMLALYFFGPRVEERIGSQRFAVLYFLSGIAGALLSFVLERGASVVGASGGVFGVMMGFAHFWPDTPILVWGIIPVPARLLVIITTVIALFSGFTGGGNVAHFAHLGGYAGAFLYLKWIERSSRQFRRKATAPAPVDTRRLAGYQAIDRSRIHEVNREEVDRILDKISASGIDSLTTQERLFLSNFVPMDDRKPPVS